MSRVGLLVKLLFCGLGKVDGAGQNERLPPLRSWVRFSLRTLDTYVKRVSQRSTETRGFSPCTPVSSHRECWQGGLGLTPNGPAFHRSCAPWSDMSHKVATKGALRKPSTRSGWAASFAIQFSSQLQVRMISTTHLPKYGKLKAIAYFLRLSQTFQNFSRKKNCINIAFLWNTVL
jgi:hypothetical protein